MALLLLGGIPGQAKTAAAVKIASSLKESGVSVGQPANVEEELLELFPEYKGASTLLKDPLVSLIGERAQDEIRDKWPEAYARAVEKATAGKPDVAIVTLCFEYYRYETYEFYSPVNSKAVKDSNANLSPHQHAQETPYDDTESVLVEPTEVTCITAIREASGKCTLDQFLYVEQLPLLG